MKKRALILFASGTCLVFLVGGWLQWNKRYTQFQGRSVTDWSLAAYGGDTNASVALKKLAPRGVTLLIELTEYSEPAWRQKLRAVVLKSPGFIRARYSSKLAAPDSWLIRNAAIRSLGLIGPGARESIPTLAQIMKTAPNEIRTEAAIALGRIGKDSVPMLTLALTNGDLLTASAALTGLGEVGKDAETAIPYMLPFLTNRDGNTRLLAGYSLTQMDPVGLLAVIDWQADGDEKQKQAGIDYLGRRMTSLRPPVIVLRELTRNNSPEMRSRAMKALGRMRPATAMNVRMLIAGLKDPAPDVVMAAVQALENIGGRAAIALPDLTVLLDANEPGVRIAAQTSIERIKSLTGTNWIPTSKQSFP